MDKQEKHLIRKDDLIKEIARKCDQYQKDVAVMQEALQSYIEELIVKAPKDKPTMIKVFDGISIFVEPKEAEEKYLPLFQEVREIPERILLSADVTDHYKIKVNRLRKGI